MLKTFSKPYFQECIVDQLAFVLKVSTPCSLLVVITVTIDSVWGLAKIINRVMCCNEVSPVIQLSPATEAQTVNLKVNI